MKFTNLKWAAMAALVLASCSESDGGGKGSGNDDHGTGSMEILTPEQSKEFLQAAASELMNQFNPNDQKEAVELAAYFGEKYGDLEMPSNWDFEEYKYSPYAFMKAVGQAAKGNIEALTRSVYKYTYNVKFSDIAGVYEPGYEEWVKTATSKDIVFKFKDQNGSPVELKVTQSGGESDIDYSWIEDDEWDGDRYEYYYYLSIPKNVEATLTANGKKIANAKCVSSIDMNGKNFTADATANLQNLSATTKTTGNNNKVQSNTSISINNNLICTSTADLNGSRLFDEEMWASIDSEDEDYDVDFGKIFKNASCKADLLGKIQVYGDATYYDEFIDDTYNDFDLYDYGTVDNAQKACQNACNRLNDHFKIKLKYNGTATDQGVIKFVPYVEKDYYDTYVYYIPQLLYPDETTYDIDYYINSFSNMGSSIESLLAAYENMWEQAIRRK